MVVSTEDPATMQSTVYKDARLTRANKEAHRSPTIQGIEMSVSISFPGMGRRDEAMSMMQSEPNMSVKFISALGPSAVVSPPESE